MNRIVLLGRLTKDPEVRYTQSAEPVAVCKYTLAVNRAYKREGEAEADFINVVAFGKRGEFAEKYFKKGQMVAVEGRLQVRSWENDEGKRQWATDVVVDNQYFAGSKNESKSESENSNDGFYPINETVQDEDLPF